MKICPQCQTSYTDDSLQFCLQDGTPLAVGQTASNNWNEPETAATPTRQDKFKIDVQNSRSQQNWASIPEMKTVEPPKKSNTVLIVVVTALLTLLAAGAIVGGIYFTRGGKTEVAPNTNSKPANTIAPNVSRTNKTSNANSANSNSNTNANTVPSASPSPKPALNPKDAKNIQSEVENVINDWKDATENFDLDAQVANYDDTVDYYRAGKIGVGAVRADKQNAFSAYSDISIDISNMRITPDETGENAVAVFDKEWNFEGEGKSSAGKVQQQLRLAKINGNWRITGERDLKVYYTR